MLLPSAFFGLTRSLLLRRPFAFHLVINHRIGQEGEKGGSSALREKNKQSGEATFSYLDLFVQCMLLY